MTEHDSVRRDIGAARIEIDRCERCGLHLRSCLCGELEPLTLATRVVVLRHRREIHKPTNTGRLVPLTLAKGQVRVFGARDMPFDATGLIEPARRTLLLYPSADSTTLTRDDARGAPITLIVPDADWRRAYKLVASERALADLPRVHLPPGRPSAYRLRRHTNPAFLATFEAIARALGILEGAEVQTELERVFQLMVERTLRSRGRFHRSH